MQDHHCPSFSIPAGFANAKPSTRKSHLNRPKLQLNGCQPSFVFPVPMCSLVANQLISRPLRSIFGN
jgi:hypothetical protein